MWHAGEQFVALAYVSRKAVGGVSNRQLRDGGQRYPRVPCPNFPTLSFPHNLRYGYVYDIIRTAQSLMATAVRIGFAIVVPTIDLSYCRRRPVVFD